MAELVLNVTPAPETAATPTLETPVVCSCGAGPHATRPNTCVRGHLTRGNQNARKSGVYAFRDRGAASLPPDVRLTVAEFKAQVERDRGGREELSAIEAARIGHLAEVETTLRLLASDLAQRGLTTAKGRVRSTFSKWLDAISTWERLAARIGDGRRARQLPSLSEYMEQARTSASPEQEHA